MKQLLIALDQLLNTLTWSSHDKKVFERGFGYADETLSARAFRLSFESKYWKAFKVVLDILFWFDKDHCFSSWLAEFNKKQYPTIYSDLSNIEAKYYGK